MKPDYLPTGKPVVGERRSYGELPVEQRLGVGVVGLHEGLTLMVALRASGLCKPVAGCDLSEEKRSAALEASPGLFVTESYENLLQQEDVKIVAIYTPDNLHSEQILKAFEAGKDVICTKPLINDPAAIPLLLEVANRSGRRLQVGQSTRFGEPFLRQREEFENGSIGEVEMVQAHYNHRMDWFYEKSPWFINETNWVYSGLSHPVDLVRWYLGEIAEVHAFGTQTSLGKQYNLPTSDAIVVSLLSRDGRVGQVYGNYGIHELAGARSLIECFLMGSNGSSLARYPDLKFTRHDARGVEIEEDYHHAMAGYHYRHELKGMHYGEFCNYTDYFASCILSGAPNSPDLSEGLQTVMVMRAIVESLQTGKPVQPDNLS